MTGNNQEIHMNNQITSKFVALGAALLLNVVLLGGVAYLFNSEAQLSTQTLSLAQATTPAQTAAV
jgi:hypothetical protein